MVKAFLPKISGLAAVDNGWDEKRCGQFQEFLNTYAADGWRLHSSEYRLVSNKGCSKEKASWLVCIFEKLQ